MIELKNVTKKYGDFTAVNDVSFKIEKGEIVGFLGQNGAGKTTTMKMITRLAEPTEGEIFIDGEKITRNSRKKIGYMPENTPLYQDLTVKEFINYMAELKCLKKQERKDQVEKLINDLSLADVQNKLIRNISRRYKQRVSMAGALVGNPEILILDEPTVGLDPKQIIEIRSLIKSLRKNHTVFLSSHILSEISQMCQKVIILNKGKIVAIDTPKNLESKIAKNSIIIDSSGLKYIEKGIFMTGWRGIYGYFTSMKGRVIAVDYEYDENIEKVSLRNLQEIILERFPKSRWFHSHCWKNIEDFKETLFSCTSFEEIAQLFVRKPSNNFLTRIFKGYAIN